jgi:[amino group carrier protein]-lysine/ornithine hydrolase
MHPELFVVPSDEAAIDLLHGLVATPSLSCQERPAVEYLVAAMQRLGFDAHIDTVGNAVGSIGTGTPHVVLLGHIDTVAGDVPVQIEDGKLYGRGAVDAKGPLAAFVVAAARAYAAPSDGGRVTVVGCVEEEAPSSRGAHGVVAHYAPDFCVVGEPSGADTITLGYKGSLRARVRLAQAAGHSAHDRATAAEQGVALWQRIQAWAEHRNEGRTRAWEQVLPALVGIGSGGDGIADWCVLDLSIRLPEDCAPDEMEAALRDLAAGASVEVLGAVPAFRAERSSPIARALIAGIRERGTTPRFVVKTGTSDMNVVGPAWRCPIATYGPGDSHLDHTPHEHIVLDEYLRAIDVLAHALRMLTTTTQPV